MGKQRWQAREGGEEEESEEDSPDYHEEASSVHVCVGNCCHRVPIPEQSINANVESNAGLCQTRTCLEAAKRWAWRTPACRPSACCPEPKHCAGAVQVVQVRCINRVEMTECSI